MSDHLVQENLMRNDFWIGESELFFTADLYLGEISEILMKSLLRLVEVVKSDQKSSVVFLQALYMFLALAIVCDDYFVMSLEKICEVGLCKSHRNDPNEFPFHLSNTAVQWEQQNPHCSSSDPLWGFQKLIKHTAPVLGGVCAKGFVGCELSAVIVFCRSWIWARMWLVPRSWRRGAQRPSSSHLL